MMMMIMLFISTDSLKVLTGVFIQAQQQEH